MEPWDSSNNDKALSAVYVKSSTLQVVIKLAILDTDFKP